MLLGLIILCIASGILGIVAWNLFYVYDNYSRREEENDNFSRLMQEMLELDADRLRVQEDLLREACRSWAETYDEKEEE